MIIGEYSPRRSRGEYSLVITEPEANNCFSNLHKSFVFFGTEFILILLICLSVTSTKRLAAISHILVLLYSPVGEYNSLIRQI